MTALIGNAVATIVIAKWENALDERRMQRVLNGEALPAAVVQHRPPAQGSVAEIPTKRGVCIP
jgi:hypothetical protein